MKIAYETIKFSKPSLEIIEQASSIIEEYQAQGFTLTLRQLYYQFVSRDLLPNTIQSYKRLGNIINDARMAGEISWEAIEDRTRNLNSLPHWSSPWSIMNAVVQQYRLDKWSNQQYKPECFISSTPIITKEGIIPIDCIEIGDQVLTHEGRYKKVTKVIKTPYKGDILNIKIAGLQSIGVTPNHPLFVDKKDPHTKYKGKERKFLGLDWVTSDKLDKFDIVTIPYIKKRVPLKTLHTIKGGKRSNCYTFNTNDLLLKMLGLYLAEGSVRNDGRTVQFTFNYTEEEYANLVCQWATKVGINSSLVFGKGTRIVYLYSKALCDWLIGEFGNGAYHKRIPQWLMEAPIEDQLVLLLYYFNGDGTFWDVYRSAPCVSTRSIQLAMQVQLILLWAKFSCSLNSIQDHGTPIYRVSIGGESADRLAKVWNIDIPEKGIKRSKRFNHILCSNDYIRLPVREISTYLYDGFVYNLEVADDHSYCTPIASHNCWIEKEALVGIISGVCEEFDVPYFACRGYNSQSEQWAAGMRFKRYIETGQIPIVFHLGDHDPSGIDMTDDNQRRLNLFSGGHVEVQRLALNYDQVELYNPPPNPAKSSDSRFNSYYEKFGDECWELDALEPQVISDLVRFAILDVRDEKAWDYMIAEEDNDKDKLRKAMKETE